MYKDLVEERWKRKERSARGLNGRAAKAIAFFASAAELQSGLLKAFFLLVGCFVVFFVFFSPLHCSSLEWIQPLI